MIKFRVGLLLLLINCGFNYQVSSQEVTVDSIRSAYIEREKSVSSLRWEWTGVRVLKNEPKGFPKYPSTPTGLDSSGSVVLVGSETRAGLKARVDRNYVGWNESREISEPDSVSISVYKDEVAQSYWKRHSSGLISTESEAEHIVDIKFIGLTYTKNPVFLSDTSYAILPGVDAQNGAIVIGRPDQINGLQGREEYILDPQMDFAVIGWRALANDGITLWEVMLNYERNADEQLIPTSFELFRYSPVNPDVAIEHQILAIDNFEYNPVVNDELFEIEFPHGTMVYDAIRDFEFTVEKSEDVFLSEVSLGNSSVAPEVSTSISHEVASDSANLPKTADLQKNLIDKDPFSKRTIIMVSIFMLLVCTTAFWMRRDKRT